MSTTYNLEHISDGKLCSVGNADDEHGMCAQCQAAYDDEAAYWKRQYEMAPLRERDPLAYAQGMHDSGRGHLLTQAERDLIER